MIALHSKTYIIQHLNISKIYVTDNYNLLLTTQYTTNLLS